MATVGTSFVWLSSLSPPVKSKGITQAANVLPVVLSPFHWRAKGQEGPHKNPVLPIYHHEEGPGEPSLPQLACPPQSSLPSSHHGQLTALPLAPDGADVPSREHKWSPSVLKGYREDGVQSPPLLP